MGSLKKQTVNGDETGKQENEGIILNFTVFLPGFHSHFWWVGLCSFIFSHIFSEHTLHLSLGGQIPQTEHLSTQFHVCISPHCPSFYVGSWLVEFVVGRVGKL